MTTHLTVESLGVRPPPTERQDVVLVGAGMSSLYIAWRLLQENPSLHIAVLERINHTGGRLDSNLIDLGHGNVVKEEQGGMRFTFDAMDELMALFLTLGIEEDIVPFPMRATRRLEPVEHPVRHGLLQLAGIDEVMDEDETANPAWPPATKF